MKRFVSIFLVALLLVSVAATALAYEGYVNNPPKGEWKSLSTGYVNRAASGSFWKATYTAGENNTTSKAYLYKQGGDRCTLIESFTRGTARTGLNYLSGQAVTGANYKLNCCVPNANCIKATPHR